MAHVVLTCTVKGLHPRIAESDTTLQAEHKYITTSRTSLCIKSSYVCKAYLQFVNWPATHLIWTGISPFYKLPGALCHTATSPCKVLLSIAVSKPQPTLLLGPT